MARRVKQKLIGIRFRNTKGHFTKARTGKFTKAESYDKKSFKTLKKERSFSKTSPPLRRIRLITRTKLPPIPPPPTPPPPEERKNWKVIIEFIVSPPKRELRVMLIINKTVTERDALIAERISFLVEELGAGISNVTIEERL